MLNTITLPYDNVSRSLNKIFKNQNLTVTYKSSNTIKSLLGNPKDKINNNKNPVFIKLIVMIVIKFTSGRLKDKLILGLKNIFTI